uniref:Uncharacterized protein n=1 Tax=Pipistrellus kuhlii TaxID=59472 RepID=A0A7J8A8N3_PIPKU|nr:hypothetical protein mPipKuh1_008888 [Pipistrellus kuhlii]
MPSQYRHLTSYQLTGLRLIWRKTSSIYTNMLIRPDILPDKAGAWLACKQPMVPCPGHPNPQWGHPIPIKAWLACKPPRPLAQAVPNPHPGHPSGQTSWSPPMHQASIVYNKRVICKFTLKAEGLLDQSL